MNEIQVTMCEKAAAELPELGLKEQPAWLTKTTVSEKQLPAAKLRKSCFCQDEKKLCSHGTGGQQEDDNAVAVYSTCHLSSRQPNTERQIARIPFKEKKKKPKNRSFCSLFKSYRD